MSVVPAVSSNPVLPDYGILPLKASCPTSPHLVVAPNLQYTVPERLHVQCPFPPKFYIQWPFPVVLPLDSGAGGWLVSPGSPFPQAIWSWAFQGHP